MPPVGEVTKVTTEIHVIGSAVSYEADRSQQGAEEVSAVPLEDGVTETMPVNHGTASAVSPETDRSHEDEQGADGSQKAHCML